MRAGFSMNTDNALYKRGQPAKKDSRLFARWRGGFPGSASSPARQPATESFDICPQASFGTGVCAPTSDVTVSFFVSKRVAFGERIAVVGPTEKLGCWRPSDGLPLQWSEGDIWTAEISLQPGVHEFKCVTLTPDGRAEWEYGGNRVIQVPAEGSGGLHAHCEWANTKATTLVTRLPPSTTDGAYAEMPITPDTKVGAEYLSNSCSAVEQISGSQSTAVQAQQLGYSLAKQLVSVKTASRNGADASNGVSSNGTSSNGSYNSNSIALDNGISSYNISLEVDRVLASAAAKAAAVKAKAAAAEKVAAAAAPAGLEDDCISRASSNSYQAAVVDSSAADDSTSQQLPLYQASSDKQVLQRQQLPQEQVLSSSLYSSLNPADPSEDLSMYSYGQESSSMSGSLTPELSLLNDQAADIEVAAIVEPAAPADADVQKQQDHHQQQPLKLQQLAKPLQDLKAAAATAALAKPLTVDTKRQVDADSNAGHADEAEQDSGSFAVSSPPSIFSGRVGTLSSRMSTSTTNSSIMRPFSYSSMEVSEAALDEAVDGSLMQAYDEKVGASAAQDDNAAPAPTPAGRSGYVVNDARAVGRVYTAEEAAALAASAVVASAADTVAALLDEQLLESQLLQNPLAYEQLMAVEPAVLMQQQVQQQHQQQLQARQQDAAAKAGSLPVVPEMSYINAASVFASVTGTAAADDTSTDDAAAVYDLNGEADGANMLPQEATLPPAALIKFAAVLEAEADSPASYDDAEVDDTDDVYNTPTDAMYPSLAAAPSSSDDSISDSVIYGALEDQQVGRRTSDNSSTSDRLSKDQLPDLGLTVTVPSAAEAVAQAAAELRTAQKEAAAVAAAAKPAHRRGGNDQQLILDVPVATEGLRLVAAAHIIPHVDKVATGGEDAFFISQAGHGAVGVSDGVSAWAEDGIDPGEYSRTLVQYCAEAIEDRVMSVARAANRGSYISKFDPRSVLRYAQQCTCKPGSATVVLAALQPEGKLHVANLGDCGVKVVRNGKIIHETQPQQHDFNLPYQLSHPRLFPDTDTADSADRYIWNVEEGDVIVAASDGLFDNLWDDELVEILQQGLLGVNPLDGYNSMPDSAQSTRNKSFGSNGHRRSRSFGAVFARNSSSNSNGSSTALPEAASAPPTVVSSPAAAVAGRNGSDASSINSSELSRSRSTNQLAFWGAKQLRQWKMKGSKFTSPASAAVASLAGGIYAALAEESDGPGMAAASLLLHPLPSSPAEVGQDVVARTADLLAAAAAAHAADKEFKSPWSVAAGKAYGLLARLFAKGGKMDDITCVVAVVQDAAKLAKANGADGAAADMFTDDVAAVSGAEDTALVSHSSSNSTTEAL